MCKRACARLGARGPVHLKSIQHGVARAGEAQPVPVHASCVRSLDKNTQQGAPTAMAVTCTAQSIEAMYATTVTNHGKAWQWWPCRRQQCDVALTTSRMDAASMNWGRLVFSCRARGRLSSRTATWDPRSACRNAVPRAPEPATRARQTGLAGLTCPPSASVRARETWGFAEAYAHQLLWVQIVIDTSACASCSCQSRT